VAKQSLVSFFNFVGEPGPKLTRDRGPEQALRCSLKEQTECMLITLMLVILVPNIEQVQMDILPVGSSEELFPIEHLTVSR
jgi:hypothetical protein